MKAIFATVIVRRGTTDTDISERISEVSYDRDVEKENFMTVVIEQSFRENATDVPVRKGDSLLVQYGYKGGKQSNTHTVRVTDIERDYVGRKVRWRIKGRDEGVLMKKTASVQVWNNVTLSEIARTIAGRYGLSYSETEPTTHRYASLPQAQRDDWGFLQSVVAMEKTGNYICYIEDGTLYLERRAFTEQSQWLIDYAWGENQNILSLKIKENESQQNTAPSASTTAVGFDTDEAEMLTEMADDSSTDEDLTFDGLMGDFVTAFSGDSEDIGEKSINTETEAQFSSQNGYGERGVTPVSNKDELRGIVAAGKKSGTVKRKEMELEIEGLPEVLLNTVITLSGVPDDDIGNYVVKCVRDKVVVGSGYRTSLTCWKNAGRKPSVTGQEKETDKSKINKTVGQETTEDKNTVIINRFSADGVKKD